jgi:hypothetical protein
MQSNAGPHPFCHLRTVRFATSRRAITHIHTLRTTMVTRSDEAQVPVPGWAHLPTAAVNTTTRKGSIDSTAGRRSVTPTQQLDETPSLSSSSSASNPPRLTARQLGALECARATSSQQHATSRGARQQMVLGLRVHVDGYGEGCVRHLGPVSAESFPPSTVSHARS